MIEKDSYEPDYQVGIGVMTGTSLDGVDLCLARFDTAGYEILEFECFSFPEQLKTFLSEAQNISGADYFLLENEFSLFLAKTIWNFNEKHHRQAGFAGVHGQTIFHDPNKQLTHQMLNGSLISSISELTTVCDFRSADVALGGQGAPLVPIGDSQLFSDYSACLNLGGFANISREENGERIAFDICPVNFVLNHFSKKLGKEFDEGGNLARSGEINMVTLKKLNTLDFYKMPAPKSLGREWVEEFVLPIMSALNPKDALRTFTEHAAEKISQSLPKKGKTLVTGGGAYNEFLIAKIGIERLVIPNRELIEGKEALIFAYLAKLRLEGQINVLSSVTGASRNSCSGAVYLP
ncbi:MAG: anhydro-N-acetylmuramic acid kinase [Bacteroidota bacterium]